MSARYPQIDAAQDGGADRRGEATPKAFSARTLAQRWGCSPKTVLAMVKREELKHFKVGSLVRIPLCEVKRVERSMAARTADAENQREAAAG